MSCAVALPDDLSCYYAKDPSFGGSLEIGGGKGRSYRGLVSTTVSGRTCQKWTETHPWKEAGKYRPSADKKSEDGTKVSWGTGVGNHNYCRNPDMSEDQPWCYTMDTQEKHKKELCEIPKCPTKLRDFQKEHKGTVVKISATDCECMDELHGSSRTTKDTSVPTYTGLIASALQLACTKPCPSTPTRRSSSRSSTVGAETVATRSATRPRPSSGMSSLAPKLRPRAATSLRSRSSAAPTPRARSRLSPCRSVTCTASTAGPRSQRSASTSRPSRRRCLRDVDDSARLLRVLAGCE